MDVEIRISVEVGGFWSYAGKKKNQRWTWYVIERETGIIPALHNGKRTDESRARLMDKLSDFPIRYFHTDGWQSYSRFIPPEKHIIGKDNTWRIKRRNLNFRTHIKRLVRKTICFSKNERIHDNVIGMYINRCYFNAASFLKST